MSGNGARDLKIKVFCDFDGTLTIKDIGDEFFKKFSVFEPAHSEFLNDNITVTDYYYSVFDNLKINNPESEVNDFLSHFEIDSNFFKFYGYCKDNCIEVSIISDGFDFYIKPFLESYNLNDISLFCNTTVLKSAQKLHPIFKLANESCKCKCASCKRNIMLTRLEDETISVFIGDGVSDYCVAEHSDVIFAKKGLAAYCNEKKLPHYPFSNFFDVYRIFQSKLNKHEFKQRRQAVLLRKKAFEIE